jgi:hypothetical protein
MMKIPTLFERGEHGLVVPKITPGCEWAATDGGGLLTIMIDGQNVKVAGGKLLKRVKPADPTYTEGTYVPCTQEDDPYLYQAYDAERWPGDGIYEAYGPKINGNPHGANANRLVKIAPVDTVLIVTVASTKIKRGHQYSTQEFFDSLKLELSESPEIEGFVFQFENPGMKLQKAAKIKRKDFGLTWPPPKVEVPVSATYNESLLLTD